VKTLARFCVPTVLFAVPLIPPILFVEDVLDTLRVGTEEVTVVALYETGGIYTCGLTSYNASSNAAIPY
jgi:hypothetical protein